MEVQEATIESAEYHTLFTRDGLSVTKASFWVRNSRQQFLALSLPEGAEIWSAFVNGRAEKPALPTEDKGRKVLLKIIHSTEGFPVEITWADDTPALGSLGKLKATLPTPGILATRTRWNLYLPNGLRYRTPETNMELVQTRSTVSAEKIAASFKEVGADQTRAPLRIDIPVRGQHFAFEKLYANRADNTAWISLRYSTRTGSFLGAMLSVFAVVLIGISFQAEQLWPGRTTIRARQISGGLGIAILIVAVTALGVSAWPAAGATVVLVILSRKGTGLSLSPR